MTSPVSTFDEADLNGFVDGRIEPSRAAALAESLAGDREARDRIDGWKRQNETLRTLFASVLFEPVPIRLLPTTIDVDARAARPTAPTGEAGAVGAGMPAARPPRHYFGLSGRMVGMVATTSIGMALAGFAAGALTSLGTNGFGFAPLVSRDAEAVMADPLSPERALAERAAETHQTYLSDATKPVEVSATEGPRLLRWLQSRLAATIRIPDLQRQGWALLGGRVVPGQYGPAAFMVYGNGVERLGLYMARTPALRVDGTSTVEAGPLQTSISYWGDETFGYALTTSRPAAWLDRNAAALRDTIRSQIRDNLSAN